MKELTFCVAGIAPVPKGRPRFYNGHAVTPPKTRDYEKLVRQVAEDAVERCGWVADEAECVVYFDVYRAARRGDCDNFLKLATDAMNKVVYADDKSICEIHARRFDDKKNPRIEVKVVKQ